MTKKQLIVTCFVLQAGDVATTWLGRRLGIREGGIVPRFIPNKRWPILLLWKLGVIAFVLHQTEKDPRPAVKAALPLVVTMSAVAVMWNCFQIVRKLRSFPKNLTNR